MYFTREVDEVIKSLKSISAWQNHAILSYDKAEREYHALKWNKSLRDNTEELIRGNTPEERAEICAVLREIEGDLLKVARGD